jgi:acyl-coenzyme A thioesterase PaaI-like protein
MEQDGSKALRKDGRCFVCGPDNERGLQAVFQIDKEKHRAESRLRIPGWTQGWKDVVHGGLLATILDEACVHAARTLGPLPVTAELTVRYRKPVLVDTEIHVFAQVRGRKRRIVEVCARIEIGKETHAEAEAKIFIREI